MTTKEGRVEAVYVGTVVPGFCREVKKENQRKRQNERKERVLKCHNNEMSLLGKCPFIVRLFA